MTIFFPRESDAVRVALSPDNAGKLHKLGLEVVIQAGLGGNLGWRDEDYAAKGAHIAADAAVPKDCGLVVRVNRPPGPDAAPRGAVHLSSLDPFREKELVGALAAAGISVISVEMIPRTTIAQKMDVLSSQASLAGYAAVILAAARLDRVFPMMMTPSGTIAAAKVFIVGAGVAGLQAIATAKRLGSKVEAFDTRPAVEEQVQSLGAKFVKVDLGETGQTAAEIGWATDNKIDYWQLDVVTNAYWILGAFTPYAGAGYSYSQVDFSGRWTHEDPANGWVDYDASFSNENKFTALVGMDVDLGKNFKVNIQGTFVSRTALTLGISYCF